MTVKTPGSLGSSGSSAQRGDGIDGDAERCRYQQDGQESQLRNQLVGLLPRLRRFAFSLTRNSDSCNDLVQETCLRALSKSELWQEGTRLDSWLFRIAQNIWLDRKRAEKTRGETVDMEVIASLPGADGRAVTESSLTLGEVVQGMSRLKPDHQVVLGLVCVDGMSYKEAAEVLELPIGTVMSRLSRARLELSAYLDRSAGPGQSKAEGGRD